MTKTKTCFDPNDLMHINFYIYVSKKHSRGGGGGVTCHDFSYGCAAGAPGPHPLHMLGEVKKQTNSYTFISRILPIHILYPLIYFLGEKYTPLIYFWCENDTPFIYSEAWKVYPIPAAHLCIYLYNGRTPPPPSPLRALKTLDRKWWKLKKIQINKINVFIDEILLQII